MLRYINNYKKGLQLNDKTIDEAVKIFNLKPVTLRVKMKTLKKFISFSRNCNSKRKLAGQADISIQWHFDTLAFRYNDISIRPKSIEMSKKSYRNAKVSKCQKRCIEMSKWCIEMSKVSKHTKMYRNVKLKLYRNVKGSKCQISMYPNVKSI